MAQCSNSINLSFPNIADDSYLFEFLGVTNPSPGIYRWCYRVTEDSPRGRGLSHFILEFCPSIMLSNVSNVTVTFNGITTPTTFEFGDIRIFPPNVSPSIYGIKFDDMPEGLDGSSAVFCFDLNVNVEPAPGDLSIKTGGGSASPDTVLTVVDAICTPGCDTPPPPPPPGRGLYCGV
jgi:hypothetical protein